MPWAGCVRACRSSAAAAAWARSTSASCASGCPRTCRVPGDHRSGLHHGPTAAEAEMIDARVHDLLGEVGLKPSPDAHATIVGHDPVLGYRFPVGEAAA